MCFHNALSREATEIENRFDARFREKTVFKPVYYGSGFSFMQWAVITMEKPLFISMYHWGLIPYWVKTAADAQKIRQLTLNAQGEHVFEKPSFKYSIIAQRCLVLSSGFYEWQHIATHKYPYFIYLKDTSLMAMGGIYSVWTDKETGEVFNTFSILTTPANGLMASIHNSKKRMPLILHPKKEKEWLNSQLNRDDIVQLIRPLDENLMTAHTISKKINSPKTEKNTPDIQEPYIYPELNTLF